MSAGNGQACGGDAAAYVLGALEPAEADEFRRHIAECTSCREEVAAYERVTQDLPAVASEHYEVPGDLRKRVMREVRATPKASGAPTTVRAPRSRRPLVAWGGALAAVIVAVIVAVAVSSSGSGTRTIVASTGNAELRVTGDRGDLIVHRLPQLPAGRIYEMWVQRGSSPPVPTGTLFSVRSGGQAAVGVPGSLGGVSAVLVTQEPAGERSRPRARR